MDRLFDFLDEHPFIGMICFCSLVSATARIWEVVCR